MAFSLYDATVANYLQILGAVGAFVDKSLTYFREKGVDPAEVVEARLASDMRPFRLQIVFGRTSLARCHGGGEERSVCSATG